MTKRTRGRIPAEPAPKPTAAPDPTPAGPSAEARRWWFAVAAIAGGAFLLRLIFFLELHQTPMWWALLGDGQSYDEWARRLAGGDWIGSEVFYQTPLYPYLLGVVFSIVGHSLGAVRVMQAVFGATSCVLLAIAGRTYFNRRVGLIAAGVIALYPESIFFDGLIQKASLDLLLMTGLLASIGLFLQGRRRRYLAVAGLVLGAFVLNRENAFVLIPILAIWLAVAFRREPLTTRLAWIGILLAGVIVLTGPVALRNYSISGELAISTSQFGPNFYIGNHRGANGTYTPLIPGRENANQERADATTLAQQAVGHSLSPGQVSQYWFDRALGDMRAAPLQWARLMSRKLLMVINAGEFVDSESLSEDAQYSLVLRITGIFSFGLLIAMAAAGVWMTRARWRELVVLYAMAVGLMASVALFYVFSRYRYPVTPILALFAGSALAALFQRPFDGRRWQMPAVIFVCVGALAYLPLTKRGTQTAYNVAIRLSQEGQRDEALRWLERVVAQAPDDAVVHLSIGRLQLEAGDTERSIGELRQAAKLDPNLAEAHATLGRALTATGQNADALGELKIAVTLTPDSGTAHTNYGIALWNAGQQDAAIEQYRESARLQPDDPIAHNNLALALYQTGRLAEAAASFEAALRLKTDYSEAHSNYALLLAERGDLQPALNHFEAALGAQPTNFGINANTADLLLKMNQPGKAAQYYKTALANSPDSVPTVLVIIEHLADALIADHKPEEARAHLQRGLQLARAAGDAQSATRLEQAIRRAGG